MPRSEERRENMVGKMIFFAPVVAFVVYGMAQLGALVR